MKTGEKFDQLEKELLPYKGALIEASDSIISQGVSEYPILVVHQQTVEIGVPLIRREKVEGNWSVNASSLEEFVTRQLIRSDKFDEFVEVYKDPEVYLCLFVISELGAQFIFMPKE
jgi:hypothetical protein